MSQTKAKAKKVRTSAKAFCETLLKIVYDGKVHRWKLNQAQKQVLSAADKQAQVGKPVRLVVVKARREGVSTLIEGLLFYKVTTRHHRLAMIISHEQESADEIAEITRRFYEFLPVDKRPSIPGAKLPHTKTLVFDKLKSKILIETAMDVNTGRSMAIDYVHASEVAFWRNADVLMLGLLQCVNDRDPDTVVVMESTANGVGGYFYNFVQATIAGENDYELVFLPWFIDERYVMDVPDDFKATHEEERLRTLYTYENKRIKLTDEQLMWRRHTIKNKCNGDRVKFQQEYPGSIDEAFIYSGRTRFDQDKLTDLQSRVRKPIFKGFLHEESLLNGDRVHKLEENPRGYLTIYEMPQHRAEYVAFFDVSEGKEVKDRDTDYSSGDVIRCDTMEQVAHWHGRIPPEMLADEIIKLGWFYKEAFLTAENNNMGYAVVAKLKTEYGRTYIRMTHDKNGKELTREFGWRTTTKTKPLMINGLAEAINDGSLVINSLPTLEELRRYTIHADGTLGAPDGQHDDRVISIAGAVQMYLYSYRSPEEYGPGRKETPDCDGDEDDDDEED